MLAPQYKTEIWIKYSRSVSLWVIISSSAGGVAIIIIGIIIFICCRKKKSKNNVGIVNEPLVPPEQPAL